MLPRAHRMTRADLQSVGHVRRVGGDLFSLAIGKSAANKPQFACIVSKKVALRANVRNLIKRRTRAAFMKHKEGLSSESYVFTAKRQAKGALNDAILEEVGTLLRKSVR